MSRKRRVPLNYTGYVYCQNDDCEAEMEVTLYPGQKQTWDDPALDAEVDGPDECPECGRKTTKQDRQKWMEKLSDEVDDGE